MQLQPLDLSPVRRAYIQLYAPIILIVSAGVISFLLAIYYRRKHR